MEPFVSQKAQYFRTSSFLKLILDLKLQETRHLSRWGALTLVLKSESTDSEARCSRQL